MIEEQRRGLQGASAHGAGMVQVMAAGKDTGGRLAAIETTERRGYEPPSHCHHREDELLYVLEGALMVYVDGIPSRVAAGSTVFLPRGVEHAFVVVGDTARVLTVLAPAGFEGFFAEMGDPPWACATPEAIERLITTAARYGCEITGPNPAHP